MKMENEENEKKKIKIMVIISSLVIVGISMLAIFSNPILSINNHQLGNSIKSIEEGTVQINDIVPFEWDTVYSFGPYTSKEEIEEIIGFKVSNISVNNTNEDMVQLLFTKDDKVVAYIMNYDSNLGYNFKFASSDQMKISYSENAALDVLIIDEIVVLTYRLL